MSIAETTVFRLRLGCDYCKVYGGSGWGTEVATATFEAPNATKAHLAARTEGWKVYPTQRKAKCPGCATK